MNETCFVSVDLKRFMAQEDAIDLYYSRLERACLDLEDEATGYVCLISEDARLEVEDVAYSLATLDYPVQWARERLKNLTWGEFIQMNDPEDWPRLNALTESIVLAGKARRYG